MEFWRHTVGVTARGYLRMETGCRPRHVNVYRYGALELWKCAESARVWRRRAIEP